MALWSEKVADVIGLIGASFGSLIARHPGHTAWAAWGNRATLLRACFSYLHLFRCPAALQVLAWPAMIYRRALYEICLNFFIVLAVVSKPLAL